MVDRKQAINHLQRNQMTLECKGKTQGGGKLQKQQTKKRREIENAKQQSAKTQQERGQARLRRRIRTNSGAISMSGVEALTMAEPISTTKKKNSKSTELVRTVTTDHDFQTRVV